MVFSRPGVYNQELALHSWCLPAPQKRSSDLADIKRAGRRLPVGVVPHTEFRVVILFFFHLRQSRLHSLAVRAPRTAFVPYLPPHRAEWLFVFVSLTGLTPPTRGRGPFHVEFGDG